MTNSTHIVFDPLWPLWALAAYALICVLFFALHFMRSPRKSLTRMVFATLILLFVLQSRLAHDVRAPLKDVVLVAVDKSASMDFGERRSVSDAAFRNVQTQLSKFDNIEIRAIDVAVDATGETKIFGDIEAALSDVPASQRGGVILLTDGQIADTPSAELLKTTSLNVVIAGSKKDRDRAVKIINAPAYSILGEKIKVKFRVEDYNMPVGGVINAQIFLPDGQSRFIPVTINREQEIELPVLAPGQNIFELSVPVVDGEISPLNNRAILNIQGVRNRLHVLLVSGEPYPGARMFRDLLKADPGVDLIHFTILRSPDKVDMTPSNELSLIAFPFQELFEVKLKNFDLVIMDRFGLNTILPDYYFQNIRNYVLGGGALLEINGASYSTEASLYQTSLRDILPGAPSGNLLQQAFKPTLTPLGKTHPVTQPFTKNPVWGEWLQQQPVRNTSGDVLMTGIGNNPLLILSRVNEGRVAQLTSDQIWLWSRGHDGGGPTSDLLRRTVHWLMKEPELDENALFVEAETNSLAIRTRLQNQNFTAEIVKPDGTTQKIDLKNNEDGWLSGSLKDLPHGIYRVRYGTQQKIVTIGDLTTPEFTNLISTDKILANLVSQSAGTALWAEDKSDFTLREISANATAPSRSIGIRRHGASTLLSSDTKPLLPEWTMMLMGLVGALLLWWRESRPA